MIISKNKIQIYLREVFKIFLDIIALFENLGGH